MYPRNEFEVKVPFYKKWQTASDWPVRLNGSGYWLKQTFVGEEKLRDEPVRTSAWEANYSKAADTVRFKSVLTKMHVTGFSKSFLKWMLNYLPERRQFVQIDARRSDLEVVAFGVPQGSILGPFIFYLYVASHHEHIQCPCFQYADNTTFYLHSKVSKLDDCTTGML